MKPRRYPTHRQSDLFSLEPDPTPEVVTLAEITTTLRPASPTLTIPEPPSRPAGEHQLHHVGKICIISHAGSDIVVSVVRDGRIYSSFDWDTLDAFVAMTEPVPGETYGRVPAMRLFRLAPSAPPAQMIHDYPALLNYAKEYTKFDESKVPYHA